MIVGFMRHGRAEERAPGMRDEDRRLTREGAREVELIAGALRIRFDLVYTSPYRRARETAEIVSRLHEAEVKVTEALSPASASLESVSRLRLGEVTLLVGHAPSIEAMVAGLIGGGNIKMSPGSLAIVDSPSLSYSSGVLTGLYSPKHLTGET